jgi:hypothetical protein
LKRTKLWSRLPTRLENKNGLLTVVSPFERNQQVSTSSHLKKDLISETLFSSYLEVWTIENIQKPNDPEEWLCCRRPAAILCSALQWGTYCIFLVHSLSEAGHNGHLKGMNCFCAHECWERGFESHSRHECMSAFILFVLFLPTVYGI